MTEQKTVGWNTGRLYQADGQRISAFVNESGVVFFNDHSRMIYGQINSVIPYDDPTPADIRSYVMRAYDARDYTMEPEAGDIEADAWPLYRT